MTASDRILQLLDSYPISSRVFITYEPKPNGGYRRISKPNKPLGKWLREMNDALSALHGDWPSYMHGGIKKRSYVTHARPHLNKPCVITIDIKRCFDSITTAEVQEALAASTKLPPAVCAQLAAKLCHKGRIPQGFATSNFLCNLYLEGPLRRLHVELEARNVILTNYVDDLAASGALSNEAEMVNQMVLALSRAKLKTNKAKIVVMKSSQRQVVCGLLVNKRLSLAPWLRRKLMSDLANKKMSEASAEGWVSNLKGIDPPFGRKFYEYAIKKGVLKP